MNAFIVRPFGVKNGIDFDRVERELIGPAMDKLDFAGRTTMDIASAGNIRADMFYLLLTADVVVADISIHNANVFYELGVRHALRDKWTVMIRAEIDDVPFDLKTDRYMSYKVDDPKTALDSLITTLSQTKRNQKADSPVYGMIPGLKAPDPSLFVVVPEDFSEEVSRAAANKERGDLRFLASELNGFRWKREGLRLIGRAQFRLNDRKAAIETWESVRRDLPKDIEANLKLGTLYQKMGDLVASDEALKRVVDDKDLEPRQLAEARALLGSNQKTRWLQDWTTASENDRGSEALRSSRLVDSMKEYKRGFEADPTHYYSGLNAFAMSTILTELATALPDVWNEAFTDEDEAATKLREYKNLRAQLTGAVDFSLCACRERLDRMDEKDEWLAVSFADHAFLCAKPNAAALYRSGLKPLGPQALESSAKQIDLYKSLKILDKAVTSVGPVFSAVVPSAQTSAAMPTVLLFTGHRVDSPGRKTPRFPAASELIARDAIKAAVQKESAGGGPVIAIGGGASGGDLLFMEVCQELGIERHMYLIIPRDEYVKASVAPSGPDWIKRFDVQMQAASRCREYQKFEDLPNWLQDKKGYNVWQRNNLWMLYNALAAGGISTSLIALWDGQGGDGPGGTEHMVQVAADRGARTTILDTKSLFGLSQAAGT